VKANDPNVADNPGFVIESNNVEIWNNEGVFPIIPDASTINNWFDINSVAVPGAMNLAVVPIPTNLEPNTASVSYLNQNLMVSNGTVFAEAYVGNGSGLTNLNPANIASGNLPATVTNTGPIALAQLPSAVLTNNQSGVTLSGTFTGNGSGLTNISVAAISGGINTNILISGVTFYITNGIIMKIQ
jgi:hypothetical protein